MSKTISILALQSLQDGWKFKNRAVSAVWPSRADISRSLADASVHVASRSVTDDEEGTTRYCVQIGDAFDYAQTKYSLIDIDVEVMGGAPCIKGSRIPVHAVLSVLATYESFEEVKKSYKRLTTEEIREAVRFSRTVLEYPFEYEAPFADR